MVRTHRIPLACLLMIVGGIGCPQVPVPLTPDTLGWPLRGTVLTVVPDYLMPRYLDTKATVVRPRSDRPMTKQEYDGERERELERVPLYAAAPEFAVGASFVAPFPAEVLAVEQGEVASCSFEPNGLGVVLTITHPSGFLSVYGHLSKVAVDTGDKVSSGQVVAYVGNSGLSLQPHLFLALLIEVPYPGQRMPFPLRHYLSPLGFLRPGQIVLAAE